MSDSPSTRKPKKPVDPSHEKIAPAKVPDSTVAEVLEDGQSPAVHVEEPSRWVVAAKQIAGGTVQERFSGTS